MVEVRVREEHFVDHVHAVRALELQQGRHDSHAHVDQRVTHDFSGPPLHQGERRVCLPVRPGCPPLVRTRAGKAELDAERCLDAVDSQVQLRVTGTHILSFTNADDPRLPLTDFGTESYSMKLTFKTKLSGLPRTSSRLKVSLPPRKRGGFRGLEPDAWSLKPDRRVKVSLPPRKRGGFRGLEPDAWSLKPDRRVKVSLPPRKRGGFRGLEPDAWSLKPDRRLKVSLPPRKRGGFRRLEPDAWSLKPDRRVKVSLPPRKRGGFHPATGHMPLAPLFQ